MAAAASLIPRVPSPREADPVMPLLRALPILALLPTLGAAAPARADWAQTTADARGQRVEFAFRGGEAAERSFAWAREELQRLYGVDLVLLPAESLAAIADRVAAGGEGVPDLVETGGASFERLDAAGLLAPGFARTLPNWRLVDTANQPAALLDATRPTNGREVPFRRTRLVLVADGARAATPEADLPTSVEKLLLFAQTHPGRVAFPSPDDPAGLALIEQVLFATAPEPSVLWRPAGESDAAVVTLPLWAWLDTLRVASRQGGAVQPGEAEQLALLEAGEIDLAAATDAGAAAAAVAAGQLPASVRSFTLEGGTLGGATYLAVPASGDAGAGARVAADFLLSPEAQVRKADPAVWGSASVLAPERLPPALQERLAGYAAAPGATAGPGLKLVIQPLHPSWADVLRAEWQRRYGS